MPHALIVRVCVLQDEWKPFEKYNTYTRKSKMYFNEYNGRVSRYGNRPCSDPAHARSFTHIPCV